MSEYGSPPRDAMPAAEAARIRAEAAARGHDVCICAPIGPKPGPPGLIAQILAAIFPEPRSEPEAGP